MVCRREWEIRLRARYYTEITSSKGLASGVVRIGELKNDPTKQGLHKDFIDRQYAYNYEDGIVIFKPTKA